MTKPKTWEDPLDADWPPHQSATIMDLVAGAPALSIGILLLGVT
jgi:hypothetical protein